MRELKFRAWDIDKQEYITCFDISSEGCVWTQEPCCSPDYPNVILEQYTGLKDKNGKEIYEGDIVRAWGRNYEVKFCEMEDSDCSYFYQGWGYDNSSLYEEHDFVEVVGNIHENPELLEQEDAKG